MFTSFAKLLVKSLAVLVVYVCSHQGMALPICAEPQNFIEIITPVLIGKFNDSNVDPSSLPSYGSGNLRNEVPDISPDPQSEQACPSNLYEIPNTGDAEKRSTCPTYKVITRDNMRYPRDIAEVRCKCRNCVEKTGQSADNVCERKYEQMVVFEKTGCVSGVWQYSPRTYNRQIGCFCARIKEEESVPQVTVKTTTAAPAEDEPTPWGK